MYKPFTHFVLRTPLFSFELLDEILHDNQILLSKLKEQQIREAIFFASPQLANELTKLLNNEIKNINEEEQLINTIVKYLCRMSTRSTPFGLFAGCSVGILGGETKIDLSSTIEYKIRLDMQILYSISQALKSKSIIRDNLKYQVNSSLYQLGNFYRYIERYTSDNKYLMHKISSVHRTDYLETILSNARKKVSIIELAESIVSEDIEITEANSFILELINNQLLVPVTDPYVCGGDYLKKLLEILNYMEVEDDISLKLLTEIDNQLEIKNINDHLKLDLNTKNILNKLEISFDKLHLFQVDMKKINENATLGDSIINEIKSVLLMLNKTTSSEWHDKLQRFQKLFYERYEERELPLLLALDPEIGIGYPVDVLPNDIAPLIDRFSLPNLVQQRNSTINRTKISSILLNKYIEYKTIGLEELIFVDDDFKDLDENWSDLPSTFFTLFQIIQTEPNLVLKINAVSGSSGANLFTRFAYCDNDIGNFIDEIISKEDELTVDSIIAEIVHLPDLRSGNIVSRPHIRKYEIICLTNTDLPDEFQIPLSDLMISIRMGKLQLRSKKLNKQIIPRLTSAHNYQNNSIAAYRFLCDFQYYFNGRSSLYFDWGFIGQELDYKPRVKYNNSILSPATWKIATNELEPFIQNNDKSDVILKIRDWRKLKLIPRFILLSEGDNKLFVDWESFISISTLFSVIKNRQDAVFEEFLFDKNNSVVHGIDGAYTNECIVAFYKDNIK